MNRIPVVSKEGHPLMPTKPSRARKWVKGGRAVGRWSDLGVYYVQLTGDPSGNEKQSIVVGIDPGKAYSGIGVQSTLCTLLQLHLILPFGRVKARMDRRRMLRRSRRCRRIDRSVQFDKRNHRRKKARTRGGSRIPPSIHASRQFECRVAKEISSIFPVTAIGYEKIKADVDLGSGRKSARSGKGFSPVMVGQNWAVNELKKLAPVYVRYGWQKDGNGTSQIRDALGLIKDKENKSHSKPESHAIDGVAIACGYFIRYSRFDLDQIRGHEWVGDVHPGYSVFKVITRPGAIKRGGEYGYFRRQLHFEVPQKGGVRRPKGIHTTLNGFRSTDLVQAEKAGRTVIGYVGGYSPKDNVVAVYDWQWRRIGLFKPRKTRLIRRSNGLCVA